MHNIPCEVIKDLLPLYKDNCCSKETNKIIEHHLETCNECKEELKKYRDDFVLQNSNITEGQPMKTIANEWKKDKKTSFIKGIFFTSLIAAIICPIAFNVIGSDILPDGTLVEPFYLIPLMYLFLLISIISAGAIVIIKAINKKNR